jgi:tetratricopeptide (TPR) repeat protein
LARIKRQADALLAARPDDAARHDRFRAEAEEALRAKDLRAAALALEQALQGEDNPDLRRQLDSVRADLARYDELRRRAAELRRDPAGLEDALAALQDALKVWDTPQVRQEIDDCNLALQQRRDRLGVADFEAHGDIGVPGIGRVIADELLPAFKTRFDLVERGQLRKVLAELKLEAGALADDAEGRREFGRLARLRYLVVGSVTPLNGVTVHARLVDVQTGLVVQTARIAAPSSEALLPLLPQLANLLLMTDEQRLAHERRLAEQAEVRPAEPAPLPPPPEPFAAGRPVPPPLIVGAPRPPRPGRLRPEDFDRLPPPAAPPPVAVVEREGPIKLRLLQVAIELGDNSFRRGRYREAYAHFELALGLFPDNRDVRARLDRCRPLLPPAPPPPPPRPRLAVINFAELGDPRVVPPGIGSWAAEHIAPYFSPPYEVVDRAELFWYMGRLNMTVADLLNDAGARRWLGRALDVRFFLLGTVRQAASFDVTTHLIDAEYGFVQGVGRVHVHDPHELKLCLPELARLTLCDPRERDRHRRDVEASRALVVEARRAFDRGEFAVSLRLCEKALTVRPNSVEVRVLLERTRERTRLAERDEARRREFERQQALAAERERRLRELAREAEAARRRAEQEAAALAEAERRRRAVERDQAYDKLLVQGRAASQQENFTVAVQLFESAVSLKRTDAAQRELTLARARAEEATRARAAKREADLRRQREAELAKAHAQLEEERRRREADEKSRREAQEARDREQYARLLDQAHRLLAQGQFDSAIAALQDARRLRRSDEAEQLLQQALAERDRAAARQKEAKERADLERKLAEEKKRREQAEAEAARRKQEEERKAAAEVQRLLNEGRAALKAGRIDAAVKAFGEAKKLVPANADVLAGLSEAERAREEAQARARREQEAKDRAARLRKLLDEGQAHLKAGRLDAAEKSFDEAKKLAPADPAPQQALRDLEQARKAAAAEAERKKRQADYERAMNAGRAALAAKNPQAAITAFSDALRFVPGDRDATTALRNAERARDEARAAEAKKQEGEKRRAAFDRLMKQGRAALAAKRFDEAVKVFGEAAKLQPSEAEAAKLLREANQAMEASKKKPEPKPNPKPDVKPPAYARQMDAGAAAEKQERWGDAVKAYREALRAAPGDAKATEALRSAEFKLRMADGRKALKAKKFAEAAREFEDALKLFPDNAEAKKLLRQAREKKP